MFPRHISGTYDLVQQVYWYDMGFKDIHPSEFVGMKSQNVTPEYMKSFTDLGYKNVKPENLVAFKD